MLPCTASDTRNLRVCLPVPAGSKRRPVLKAGQFFKRATWTRQPLLVRPCRCSHRLRRVGKARNTARKSMLQPQVQRAASVFMLLHALPHVVFSRKVCALHAPTTPHPASCVESLQMDPYDDAPRHQGHPTFAGVTRPRLLFGTRQLCALEGAGACGP